MKRVILGLATWAVVVLAGQASVIEVNGEMDDWTTYEGPGYIGPWWNRRPNENWDQDAARAGSLNDDFRFFDAPDGNADGGQNYDVEQLFYYYEDDDTNDLTGGTLYFGLVTGYYYDDYYDSGDFFIDLGGEGTYDIAIGTDRSESRYERAWFNEGWDGTSPGWDQSERLDIRRRPDEVFPYRIDDSRWGDDNAIRFGREGFDDLEVDVAWEENAGGRAHNFMEISIELDGFLESIMAGSGIAMHWTMSCGNDYITACDSDPLTPMPNDPPVVPLPASVVLGGIGMLGVALRQRKAKC